MNADLKQYWFQTKLTQEKGHMMKKKPFLNMNADLKQCWLQTKLTQAKGHMMKKKPFLNVNADLKQCWFQTKLASDKRHLMMKTHSRISMLFNADVRQCRFQTELTSGQKPYDEAKPFQNLNPDLTQSWVTKKAHLWQKRGWSQTADFSSNLFIDDLVCRRRRVSRGASLWLKAWTYQ